MKLQPRLLFCEPFHLRCRSGKHFSVAGFTCALTFGSPSVTRLTGWREKGLVRTGGERSLPSNKPAQMLNTALTRNDFSKQLGLSPLKATPEVRARKEGSFIKGTLLLLAFSLVYNASSPVFS